MNGDFLCPHLREQTAASLLKRIPREDHGTSDGTHLQCLLCWKILPPAEMEAHMLQHGHDFALRIPAKDGESAEARSSQPAAIYCHACHDYVYLQQQAEPNVLVVEGHASVKGPDPVPREVNVVFNEMMKGEIGGMEATVERPFWRVRGLVNLGQTCYFNSVLQAILHNPVLTLELMKEGLSSGSTNVTARGRSHLCGLRGGQMMAGNDLASLQDQTVCQTLKSGVNPDECLRCELTSLTCDPAFFKQRQYCAAQRTLAKRLKRGRVPKNPNGLMLKKKRRIFASDCIDWPKPETLNALVNPVTGIPNGRANLSDTGQTEGAVVPDRFLTELWKKNASLVPGEQQDAHECFVSVTSMLEELDRSGPPKRSRTVSQIFQGIQRSDLTCCRCGRTSTMEEPFRDLSLSLIAGGDMNIEKCAGFHSGGQGNPAETTPKKDLCNGRTVARSVRRRKRGRIQINLGKNGRGDALLSEALSPSGLPGPPPCTPPGRARRSESLSSQSRASHAGNPSPSTPGSARSPMQGRSKAGKGRWGPAVDLEQMLETYTSEERLAQNLFCANCGVATNHTKKLTLQKSPKVLVLHMKRFDPVSGSKLSRVVNFPLCGLDLDPFRMAKSASSSSTRNGRHENGNRDRDRAGGSAEPTKGVVTKVNGEDKLCNGVSETGGAAEGPAPNGTPIGMESMANGGTVTPPKSAVQSTEHQKSCAPGEPPGHAPVPTGNLSEEAAHGCGASPRKAIAMEEDEEDDPEPVYDLFALVEHKGESSNVGHYLSYVNVPSLVRMNEDAKADAVEMQAKWYKCDDTLICDVKDKEVLAKQAYMLFYCRRDVFKSSVEKTHELRRTIAKATQEMHVQRLRERRQIAAGDLEERLQLSKQRVKLPTAPSPSSGAGVSAGAKGKASAVATKSKGRAKQGARSAAEAEKDKTGPRAAATPPGADSKGGSDAQDATPNGFSKGSPSGSAGKKAALNGSSASSTASPSSRSRKRKTTKADAAESARRPKVEAPAAVLGSGAQHGVPQGGLQPDGQDFDLDFSFGLGPGMEHEDLFGVLQASPPPAAPTAAPAAPPQQAPKAKAKTSKSKSRPRAKKAAQQSPTRALHMPLDNPTLKLLQANFFAQANGQNPQTPAGSPQDLSALRINPLLSAHSGANPAMFVYSPQNAAAAAAAAAAHARPTARSKGKPKSRSQPNLMLDPFARSQMLANGKHGA